jgi:hypothetical protein
MFRISAGTFSPVVGSFCNEGAFFFGTKGWEIINRRSSSVPFFQTMQTTLNLWVQADSVSHPFSEAEKPTASFRESMGHPARD